MTAMSLDQKVGKIWKATQLIAVPHEQYYPDPQGDFCEQGLYMSLNSRPALFLYNSPFLFLFPTLPFLAPIMFPVSCMIFQLPNAIILSHANTHHHE